jgi:hypothetical protein
VPGTGAGRVTPAQEDLDERLANLVVGEVRVAVADP